MPVGLPPGSSDAPHQVEDAKIRAVGLLRESNGGLYLRENVKTLAAGLLPEISGAPRCPKW